jgi:hypothetical protein
MRRSPVRLRSPAPRFFFKNKGLASARPFVFLGRMGRICGPCGPRGPTGLVDLRRNAAWAATVTFVRSLLGSVHVCDSRGQPGKVSGTQTHRWSLSARVIRWQTKAVPESVAHASEAGLPGGHGSSTLPESGFRAGRHRGRQLVRNGRSPPLPSELRCGGGPTCANAGWTATAVVRTEGVGVDRHLHHGYLWRAGVVAKYRRDIQADVIGALEHSLWTQLQPMFGRKGRR